MILTQENDQRKAIMRKAVALLALRERSRAELVQKLSDFFSGTDSALIESVLDELESKKYLSDERFARVRLMLRSSRYGDRRLRDELRQSGISESSIDSAFEDLKETEYERAKALWDRKFGGVAKDPKEKAKQFRFLASRGFSFRVINRILENQEDEEY